MAAVNTHFENSAFFVELTSCDRALLEMQKRVNKLSLIQIWVLKATALLNRYLETLDRLSKEPDSAKHGLLVEEVDISYMSSVSYFLRGFMSQKGSLSLEIKLVTSSEVLRGTYQMLMDLRNDEYVHWKGTKSSASVKYSFSAASQGSIEFGKQLQIGFSEQVGPDQMSEEIKNLFKTTIDYIEARRSQEVQAIRERLANPDAWETTQLLNDNGENIIKRTGT